MGVGFVGAVMAGVVADSAEPRAGRKIRHRRAAAEFPVFLEDPFSQPGCLSGQGRRPGSRPLIRRCVLEKKTLTATYTMEALTLADVVVVDVQCDFLKEELGNVKSGNAEIQALEESFKIIGEKIPPKPWS